MENWPLGPALSEADLTLSLTVWPGGLGGASTQHTVHRAARWHPPKGEIRSRTFVENEL